MIDAPAWFVWSFDIVLIVAIIGGLLFLKAGLDARRLKGKMAVDIREPTGFTERHFAKPDPTGATVTVDNCVYMLTKPPSADINNEDDRDSNIIKEAAREHYPRIRFIRYPKNPLFGLSMFQSTLRLEEYQSDNPEPIHPFYGRVDEKGMFIDSQLTVTGTEWQAQKNVIQGTQIAMRVQAMETWSQALQRLMNNMPSKLIIYIGIGVAALGSIVSVVMLYQIAVR